MPWRWFVALGLLGQTIYAGFHVWEALAACLVTAVFIAFGLRAFRADYLIKASALVQGSTRSVVRFSKASEWSLLVRKVTGSPSGYGVFSFVIKMCCRDWNFRRQVFPLAVPYLLFGLGGALAAMAIRTSPFGSAGRLSLFTHLLPHCLGIVLAFACNMISFTSEPQGASIFTTLPLKNLRPFARGVYLSLWTCFVGIPHLCLLGPCIWFWGLSHGALYIAYSAILVSCYLALASLFMQGFPFINPFKPYAAAEMQIPLIGASILAVVLGAIQWFLFRNPSLVMAATAVLAVIAMIVTPLSLKNLEQKLQKSLHLLNLSPQTVFKEVE
jgi:hypothetical protein